jgi:chemotaxis protein methyltransferase CheR
MTLFSSAITLRAATPISDAEFKDLRDFIYQRSGIWVDEKRKYLFENRFHKRLATLGLKSFDEYVKLLKFDPRAGEEMKTLWEIVTTNETSFFRDIKQLESFQKVILAEVLAEQRKKGRLELSIWSAGCSSGEEPYTLAMLIAESLGLELPKWKVSITAVDLSPAMIAKAKEATYGDYAFKTTTEEQKKKYFIPAGAQWKVKPEIARMVGFQQMNLNDDAAVRRWAGFLALPFNLPLALRLLWESADALWRWAGDTATDENHYSKRAILSAAEHIPGVEFASGG